MPKLLRQLGIAVVPLGFHSSFQDWAAECTKAPREICKLAVAHVNGDRVEVAYRRRNRGERRGTLMKQWADYVAAAALKLVQTAAIGSSSPRHFPQPVA